MSDCSGLVFPVDISFGSKGGPVYSTSIVLRKSGRETRNINWTYPLHSYDVSYGVRTSDQMAALIAFFHQHYGRGVSFLYKDWNDFEALTYHGSTKVSEGRLGSGVGNGTATYPLVKRYITGSQDRARYITRPKSGTIIIYKNGNPATPTIDYDTGIVTFASPFPTGSDTLTWTGEFYVRCRFDADSLPIDVQDRSGTELIVNSSIQITEERE